MSYPTGIIRPPNAHVIQQGEVDSIPDMMKWLENPHFPMQPGDVCLVEGLAFSYMTDDGTIRPHTVALPKIEKFVKPWTYRTLIQSSPYQDYGVAWNTLWAVAEPKELLAVYFDFGKEVAKRKLVRNYLNILLDLMSEEELEPYRRAMEIVDKILVVKGFSLTSLSDPEAPTNAQVFLRAFIAYLTSYATEHALDGNDSRELERAMQCVSNGIASKKNLSAVEINDFLRNYLRVHLPFEGWMESVAKAAQSRRTSVW